MGSEATTQLIPSLLASSGATAKYSYIQLKEMSYQIQKGGLTILLSKGEKTL